MFTTVSEDRLLVLSDVHLGNRLFRARRPFAEFLHYAYENSYSLCINGDGVDIVQTTLAQLTRDLSECGSRLTKFVQKGLRIYYTVGNHDIALENFLDDWELFRVVPFLNVQSGDQRIRIEHGHLYDEFFVQFPGLYMAFTLLGGLALKIHPRVYKSLESVKPVVERIGRALSRSGGSNDDADDAEYIPNESVYFRERAIEISRHGFDYVLLGHTHGCGQVRLPTGAIYINTGSWLFEPHYVEINHGEVTLKKVEDLNLRPLA